MKRILCVLMVLLLLSPFSAGTEQIDDYYRLGDTVEDFSLTTPDGEEYALSRVLQDHAAVLLCFWFSGCGPSRYEFPFLEKAYESFQDQIEVLAITPYDEDDAILQYQQTMGLTFPMMHDSLGICDRFVDYGFPTCVLIDRNGVICYTECGAQNSPDAFERLFMPFLTDDYSEPLLLSSIPSVVSPDAPDSNALNAALNAEGGNLTFACTGDYWPWLLSEDGSYIVSGNAGSNGTVALVESLMHVHAGSVLSFRYATSTEEGSDILAVMIDQEIVKTFSGENDWQTYAIPFEETGFYNISFAYIKNETEADGSDQVSLDSVQLLYGTAAELALESNPSYPQTLEGMQTQLEFMNSNAREIAFDDPAGVVTSFFRADKYYIIPEDNVIGFVQVGVDCDPDGAFIRDVRGNTRTLSHCALDSKGFLFTLPPTEPTLGWNVLVIAPSVTDAYGQYNRVYMYFESEGAVENFCHAQIPTLYQEEAVSTIDWHYVE